MSTSGISFGSVLLLVLVAFGMWGYPQYHVYSQRLDGEAQLAHAEYSKKVAVETAHATQASASLLAEAEVIRAEGVAKANKIIGDSLKGNEAYLRYLWVDKLDGSKQTIVYVPTETGMPIMEAGKR